MKTRAAVAFAFGTATTFSGLAITAFRGKVQDAIHAGLGIYMNAEALARTLETGEACADRRGDHVGETRRGAGGDDVAVNGDLREQLAHQADDHAADAFVADQHIRPAAEESHVQPFVASTLHDGLERCCSRR